MEKQHLEHFIKGVQASYEMGDAIDDRKELEVNVNEYEDYFTVTAQWFKGVTVNDNESDPQLREDAIRHIEDYHFKIAKNAGPRKIAKEIIDMLDVVNGESYFEEF